MRADSVTSRSRQSADGSAERAAREAARTDQASDRRPITACRAAAWQRTWQRSQQWPIISSMRRFLALLLCLTLPLQAGVALAAGLQGCPMMLGLVHGTAVVASVADGAADAAELAEVAKVAREGAHDCCVDALAASTSASPCQDAGADINPGHGGCLGCTACAAAHSPGAAPWPASPAAVGLLPTQLGDVPVAQTWPEGPASRVWRPPTAC